MKKCPSCETTYGDNVSFCPNDGAALVASSGLAPGSLIRKKYRILSEIGRGGMGVVYHATHLGLKKERAIKVINLQYASDPGFLQRFMAEALITSQIQHPNIVRVEDTDETEDGQPFVVMEYIRGESLRRIIEREGSIQPTRAFYIAEAGLNHAVSELQNRHADASFDRIMGMRAGAVIVANADFAGASINKKIGAGA